MQESSDTKIKTIDAKVRLTEGDENILKTLSLAMGYSDDQFNRSAMLRCLIPSDDFLQAMIFSRRIYHGARYPNDIIGGSIYRTFSEDLSQLMTITGYPIPTQVSLVLTATPGKARRDATAALFVMWCKAWIEPDNAEGYKSEYVEVTSGGHTLKENMVFCDNPNNPHYTPPDEVMLLRHKIIAKLESVNTGVSDSPSDKTTK